MASQDAGEPENEETPPPPPELLEAWSVYKRLMLKRGFPAGVMMLNGQGESLGRTGAGFNPFVPVVSGEYVLVPDLSDEKTRQLLLSVT